MFDYMHHVGYLVICKPEPSCVIIWPRVQRLCRLHVLFLGSSITKNPLAATVAQEGVQSDAAVPAAASIEAWVASHMMGTS